MKYMQKEKPARDITLQLLQPQFSERDYEIVGRVVRMLSDREYWVVRLHFWGNRTISEVAEILDLTKLEVKSAISSALRFLKVECLRSPGFSRGGRDVSNDWQPFVQLLKAA
jgi:DNA-directed RNA polymerase specialized sigma24 family protein